MLTFEDSAALYGWFAANEPPLAYISGKTSTGKSTFGRQLRDRLGYDVIELEAVLLSIVEEHGLDEQETFHKVLWDTEDSREKQLYFSRTDQLIHEHLAQGRRLVVEGAFANGDTLQRVLKPAPNPLVVYFHPTDPNAYIRNLEQRFIQSGRDSLAGLPRSFWQLIDQGEFEEFCKTHELSDGLEHSIRQYALASMESSRERLADYKRRFGDVAVVGVK